MSDALMRHWQMLRLVPRAPVKASTARLRDKLAERGFDIDIRSVQRDLHKLSTQFPLICDNKRPNGWSWARGANLFDVPGIDLHTALAFVLASEHLAHLLPHATVDYLKPHIARSQNVIEKAQDCGVGAWNRAVRAIPSTLPTQPPSIDREVLEAVHDALTAHRQLDVVYRRRGEEDDRTYVVNPLGLVYRDAIAYLVCTLWHYQDVKQLAVHRIVSAELTDNVATGPEDFDLDAYIDAGEFAFKLGADPIHLVARFDERAAVRLLETPIAADQTSSVADDGRVQICATLHDTVQLRVWLRSYGYLCEVMQPQALRDELAEDARKAAANYA